VLQEMHHAMLSIGIPGGHEGRHALFGIAPDPAGAIGLDLQISVLIKKGSVERRLNHEKRKDQGNHQTAP
jgi:hypothetical protein